MMQLGGGSDEADEGVTVPGDDDQLSYVSAPASDYSVTTVGSDILNNSRLSDEEDERRKMHEPRTKVFACGNFHVWPSASQSLKFSPDV